FDTQCNNREKVTEENDLESENEENMESVFMLVENKIFESWEAAN
ncbi:9769_t:CDS:2, partial [Racocetra persica]